MNQIDFLATQPHYFDHLAPIWDELPSPYRGTLWVPDGLFDYAARNLRKPLLLFGYEGTPKIKDHPVLTAAYGDMMLAHDVNPSNKLLMMEHGTGHTFGLSAYPNGKGKRDWVSLFLPPNEYTARKIAEVRDTPSIVIGTPKLDLIFKALNPLGMLKLSRNDPPTIAIGFHHGSKSRRIPENGSAFEHYREVIPELSKEFKLLAYAHPLAEAEHKPFYDSLGIEYTSDFFQVMMRADVCLNDLSSALYEFLITGKPVVVLNAPWFRRDVQHGLRFWDYSDIGVNVDQPEELSRAVHSTLKQYHIIYGAQRLRAIGDLFPYLGRAARRAADVIVNYLEEL